MEDKYNEAIYAFKNLCNENILEIATYGSGHINDTYKVTTNNDEYILQKVDTSIFADFDGMMENIKRVTSHLANKGVGTMKVIAVEKPWRLLSFVANSKSIDVIEKPVQAYLAAKSFAKFQNDLADLPEPRLNETIPEFHNTISRLKQLDDAIAKDPENRVSNTTEEIKFVAAHRDVAGTIVNLINDGKIPERITHNDTKINNILFDIDSNKTNAIVDLDTVMPGSALYDFGDMVRTATATAMEDETDLSKVESSEEYFTQLVKGYLESAEFLNKYELDNLALSGLIITFTIGVRFLTDYINGDIYFKTDYDNHNLDRARNQFKMVSDLENKLEKYNQIVKEVQDTYNR